MPIESSEAKNEVRRPSAKVFTVHTDELADGTFQGRTENIKGAASDSKYVNGH